MVSGYPSDATEISSRRTSSPLRQGARFNRLGRRLQVALDLYNAMNANTIQNYNGSYNPTGVWRTPNGILPGRVTKISGQIDF